MRHALSSTVAVLAIAVAPPAVRAQAAPVQQSVTMAAAVPDVDVSDPPDGGFVASVDTAGHLPSWLWVSRRIANAKNQAPWSADHCLRRRRCG